MDLRSFIRAVNRGAPFSGSLRFDEPMSRHTTFKTGGPADLWVRPRKQVFRDWSLALFQAARTEGIPVFVLGGGANLLVSDKGIRGIVLDTGSWRGVGTREEPDIQAEILRRETGPVPGSSAKAALYCVKVLSGTSVDGMVAKLADRGLSGLEFLAGMPGSVGGALWMNARCYEKSVSDVFFKAEILDESFNFVSLVSTAEDFAYKKSPFQKRQVFILSASFWVHFGNILDIKKEIAEYHRDREEKGHYRFPSAGSVFKNNHAFGEPTGKIIADLGLRGLTRGGAAIAPWHGNFIINTGNAQSADIHFLVKEVSRRVKEERGFDLEPEIIFAGEW